MTKATDRQRQKELLSWQGRLEVQLHKMDKEILDLESQCPELQACYLDPDYKSDPQIQSYNLKLQGRDHLKDEIIQIEGELKALA